MDPAEAVRQSARVAALFDRVSGTYDTVDVPWFTPIAERLVAELGPVPGQRALDLGTGRGAALWPLAQAVGPTGHVTGLDLAAQMIAATRNDVSARGLTMVDLVVADASAPGLPRASFDLAAASLVLFFMPDPLAALTAWVALLAPGGRLGVSTFGPREATWEELDGVFTPFLPPALLDARTSGSRGPFASDAGVAALLTSAGLTQVQTAHLNLPVHFRDVAHWQRWSMSHGQRSHWDAVPENHRDGVISAATERVGAILDPDGGFTLAQQVRYTLGELPGPSVAIG